MELLVTITIIGMLAGLMLGALHGARQTAREMATKATITKLNNIIMQRYESYMTRRVPIRIPRTYDGSTTLIRPVDAARLRLYALRLLMMMEMPDALTDINLPPTLTSASGVTITTAGSTVTIRLDPPAAFATVTVDLPQPALRQVYAASLPAPLFTTFESAQCLYKLISLGSPEAMEQFSQAEIGTVFDTAKSKNYPVFIDGWGNPISWLRWAPGYSNWQGVAAPPNPPGSSDIQTGNASSDPDPFDPRRVDVDASNNPRAFHLIPLICSAGADQTFGLIGFPMSGNSARTPTATTVITDVTKLFDAATYGTVGQPGGSDPANTHHDDITNHHIEQR